MFYISAYSIRGLILIITLFSSSFSATFSGETIESFILEGNENFNKSKYEDACHNYREGLDKQPENLPALLGLTSSLYQLELYQDTTRELKKAIQLSPRNISLYLWLVNTISAMENNTKATEEFQRDFRPRLIELWFEDDYSQTITDYQNIIEQYPESAWANYLLGSTYLRRHRTEKARRFYRKASRLATGWAAPVVRLNRTSITYDLATAVKNLNDFLRKYPDSPMINYTLGSLYKNQNHMEEARAAYQAVLTSGITNRSIRAKTHLYLYRIAIKRGDYQEALDQFNQSIALSPESLISSFLPDIFRTMKILDISPDRYRKQFQQNPDNINLAYFLAELASREMDYSEAIRLCRIARKISLLPENRSYINSRIITTAARGSLTKELENKYLSRIEKDPRDCENYSFLARLYINRGKPEVAIRVLQDGLEYNSQATLLRTLLAFHYKSRGLYPKAITEYRRLIDGTAARPNYSGNLADCYFKAGEIDQGRKILNQLCRIEHREAIAWTTAGNIYRKNGMFSDAIKSYSSALNIRPGDFFISLKLAKSYIKLRQYSRAGQVYRAAIERCDWPSRRRRLRNRLVRLYSNTGRLPELAREYENRLSSSSVNKY